jgi:hypothetical protein
MDLRRIFWNLLSPMPAAKVVQRPGPGGMTLDYVEWHTKWLRVLAVAPDATWEIVEIIPGESGFIVCGRLTIEGVSRDGVGWSETKKAAQVDIGVKDAATDALSRACALFGIGIELYGADTTWFQKQLAKLKNGGSGDDDSEGESRDDAPDATGRIADQTGDPGDR